ncbi:MAG: tripartite tricarboxylate transporter substrate binding protein [Rhodospirillales bacterium]
MKKLLLCAFAAAVASAAAVAGLAGTAKAEYPEKPVEFVVPWPPGDIEDVLTRIIAEEMQAKTGAAAAVVNKPGGGGGPFPGAAYVAKAKPDGYTIGSFVIGVPTVGAIHNIQGITDDTFEPIGIFLTYPFVLAASGDAPYSNMKELAAHAKNNKVALGHFGFSLTPTQATMYAGKKLGFEFGSEAAFDALDCNTLASGDADVINTTLQLVLPCLDKIKILAALTEERIAIAPRAQTLGEQIPGLDITLWNGLFVPKGTPQAVKNKIAAIAKAAVLGGKAKEVGKNSGALIYWMDADDAAKRIAADKQRIIEIGKALGE